MKKGIEMTINLTQNLLIDLFLKLPCELHSNTKQQFNIGF